MSTAHAIQTALEIIVASALIVGLFNENKLAAFEQKIIQKIKSR